MKKIIRTQHEWFEALKVPTPHRNKKKYRRKEKHKKMGAKFGSHNYFLYIHTEFENKGYGTMGI